MIIRNIASRTAIVAGLLDTSVAFSYVMQIPVVAWYAATLATKIILALLTQAPGKSNLQTHGLFIFISATTLLTSSTLIDTTSEVALEILGFALHLLATLLLIRPDRLNCYIRYVAISGAGIALLYLSLMATGSIDSAHGRYSFFGGGHPNLGGEILALTTVAAAIIFKPWQFYATASVAFTCMIFMQSRAAMLVVLMVTTHRILIQIRSLPKNKRLMAASTLSIILIASLPIIIPKIESAANAIFLIDDEYRGSGSGLVGRGERWKNAFSLFLNSPIYGVGYGYHAANETSSPHNLYLYGLSQLGLIFIAAFAYFAQSTIKTLKRNNNFTIPVVALLILTIFNDRFLNFNPYPFVFYIIIMIGSSKKWQR